MNTEQRLEKIEKYIEERKQQQIKYPLDVNSITILSEYFMRISESIKFLAGVSGREFEIFLGSQGTSNFQVPKVEYFRFTANPSTDQLTTQVNFSNDAYVLVLSSNTAPAGLTSGSAYYVVNTTGTSFKLSATSGGSAINITDTGTGNQYLQLL